MQMSVIPIFFLPSSLFKNKNLWGDLGVGGEKAVHTQQNDDAFDDARAGACQKG